MKTKDIIKIRKPKIKYPVINQIAERFSPRFFTGGIKDEDLNSIFEAARWTPSSYNTQPWFFYYAKKEEEGFEKLSQSLSPGNSWAKQAPILILGCYLDQTAHGKNPYAQYDLGQAVLGLVLQAQSLGYYCHQMGGFNKDVVTKNLNIKKPFIPHVMIAVGKIGDYSNAPEKIVKMDFVPNLRKDEIARKI